MSKNTIKFSLFALVLSISFNSLATEKIEHFKADNGWIRGYSTKDKMTDEIISHTLNLKGGLAYNDRLFFVCNNDGTFNFGSQTDAFNGFQNKGVLKVRVDNQKVETFNGPLSYKTGIVSTLNRKDFYALLNRIALAKKVITRIETNNGDFSYEYSFRNPKSGFDTFKQRCERK
jgi:hypothetical protein